MTAKPTRNHLKFRILDFDLPDFPELLLKIILAYLSNNKNLTPFLNNWK
jgi:hypothetical protein